MAYRAERIQKSILQILQPALRVLKDPEMHGFVTITDVSVTKDLKNATVYYSLIGSEEEKKGTQRALDRAKGYLRTLVAENLSMYEVPALQFKYDPTPERAERIERILHQLEKEREQGGENQSGGTEEKGRPGDQEG